jgi:hypothetical protein
MKKYVLIFIFLFAGVNFAQVPEIDSMLIDEMKSELNIYGSFGSVKGKVTIDSVEMPIVAWSDSLLILSIPDTGKGNSGPVIVFNKGFQSPPRIITMLSGVWWRDTISTIGNGGGKYSFIFNFRMDLKTFLEKENEDQRLAAMKTSVCKVLYHVDLQDGTYDIDPYSPASITLNPDEVHGNGFHFRSTVLLNVSIIHCHISDVSGIMLTHNFFGGVSLIRFNLHNFDFEILLDSNFTIRQITNFMDPFMNKITNVSPISNRYPPSKTILSLLQKPKLLLPLSGSLYSVKNGVPLTWDTVKLIDRYHIEVSYDSLFNTLSIDTLISGAQLYVPSLKKITKYFWRVSGLNSDGEGIWSDVWSFSTIPSLIFPAAGTLFNTEYGIILKYDSIPFISSYHVQVSTDSFFQQSSIDTQVTLTNFPLRPLKDLTNYFWRVSIVDSNIQSNWSYVWNFWTGKLFGVKENSTIKLSISSYPNPSTKELHISYTLPKNENAKFILYDLEGRIIRQTAAKPGKNILQWDVSNIPNGSYILSLIAEKEQKSQIIKIIH